MTLNWAKNDWSASTTIRYLSKITESCSDYLDGSPNSLTALGLCSNPNATDDSASMNELDPTYYVDFSVSYDSQLMDNSVRYTLGARNLFDQDPP
jgi:iron complex outermembrane receptor protein